MSKVPLPVVGNMTGAVVGLLAGIALTFYLAVGPWFDIFCFVSACILIGQLAGATLGAFFGR
jgi:hypothetical protein